jgi:hypothetical protein
VAARADIDHEIAKINENYFLVPVDSKVVVGTFGNDASGQEVLQLQQVESFKLWFKNRYVQVLDGGGVKMKPVGDYWIGHRQRRQYEGLDLRPGEPLELPNGKLNLWRGYGVDARPGDWSRMNNHICDILAAGDPKAAEYILLWAAWNLQHPGEHAEVALLFLGERGCGKGVFLRALARCFGVHALHLSNQEHLLGKFNSHIRNALFLFADEAFWAGDKRGEAVLKAITEPTLVIEQKGIDAVNWPNRLSIVMARTLIGQYLQGLASGASPFQCADTYVRGQCDDDEREVYFKALYNEGGNGGVEAMLDDLLRLDLGDWHPREVYETSALHQQKLESLSHLESWWAELLQGGKLPAIVAGTERKDFATTGALLEEAREKSPRLRGYLSEKGMASFLRKHGCSPARDTNNRAQPSGWRFVPLVEARKNWERRYGGWQWRWPGMKDWS